MTVWPHPGSRSSTGIHSLIASPLCVTQKQTQNVSFLPCFRYQKNRLCRKVACHVFSQKNLTHGFAFPELRMCNAIRFAPFPGCIVPVVVGNAHRSAYVRKRSIYGHSSSLPSSSRLLGRSASASANGINAISLKRDGSSIANPSAYRPLGTSLRIAPRIM